MYSQVLLPTDGSGAAETAVEAGLELAVQFDAAVHALYVIDSRFVTTEYDLAVEKAEREAEAALDRVGELGESAGVAAEKQLRTGIPHEEILDAIDSHGVDVVVMGTHGRSSLDRLVHLGSVTERVVRSAPVHVVTVPVGERTGNR